MTKILRIDSSARHEGSASRELAGRLIDRLHGDVTVVERDLAAGVPLLSESTLAAMWTPPFDRSDTQRAELRIADSYSDELLTADAVVIGLPIYNFGPPAAMKAWALSKGANYFAHIFYPLTGASAEKHDSFIVSDASGKAITEFNGSLLTKGEPDGSSFPNGGIRQTNAARGYTFWDPTSPAYILDKPNGATLCIPSVFVSWTGEALDKKVPLMRSNAAMNKAGTRVLALMENGPIAPLNSSCGAEQEDFLVDAKFANQRPDLLLAGRTLFGACLLYTSDAADDL